MTGPVPDPRILNLGEYVLAVEHLIGRELTPTEIRLAAEWRADKITAHALAEYLDLSSSSPSPISSSPATEREGPPAFHETKPGDLFLKEMETLL